MKQHQQYLSPLDARPRASSIRRSWDSLITTSQDRASSLPKSLIKEERFARRHSETLPRGYAFASQPTSQSSNRRNGGSGGNGSPRHINLLVIGDSGVGKSALTVRFITNRYIGDYMSGKDQIYRLDGHDHRRCCPAGTAVNILDTSSQHRVGALDTVESKLSWCDGVVVVYDVGNAASFAFARDLIVGIKRESRITSSSSSSGSRNGSLLRFSKKKKHQQQQQQAQHKPIVLVGNKSDVLRRKKVTEAEGRQLAADHGDAVVHFQELSAAEGIDDIRHCISRFILRLSTSGNGNHGNHSKRSKSHSLSGSDASPPPTPLTSSGGGGTNYGGVKKFFDHVTLFHHHHVTRKERSKVARAHNILTETLA